MGNNFGRPSKYCAVVAIDFGSAYTGYAYSYRHDKKIHLNENWGAEMSISHTKAPTSILLKEDGTFDSFGYIANRNYTRKEELQLDDNSILFRNFKMHLYGQKECGHRLEVPSVDKTTMKSALSIFAEALKYMKKHAIERMEKSLGRVIVEEKTPIRWVVTVPAIWSDKQKLFMREACLEGGLIKEMNSRNLIIALEPECASIYIKDTELDKKRGLALKDGICYMVVDLGGGTVDIAVHKIFGDAIEEVVPPNGEAWGGENVNKKYEELLSKVLGNDFLEYLKVNNPSVWLHMMLDFENVKRSFKEDERVFLPLHLGLASCYEEFTGQGKIGDKLSKTEGIKVSSNGMILDPQIMKDMFRHVLDNICELVAETLSQCAEKKKEPSLMFAVGGFAECKYVQERLRDICVITKVKPTVVIPEGAGLSVLKGATIFGHNPQAISARMLSYTYAILNTRSFRPGKDDEDRRMTINSKDVIQYLDPIIKRGTRVEEGTVKEKEITLEKSAITFGIPIYVSKSKNVDDPNDVNVTELGTIKFDEMLGANEDTKLKVKFIFGSTELEVRAMDKSTKKEVAYSFDFEHDSAYCSIM